MGRDVGVGDVPGVDRVQFATVCTNVRQPAYLYGVGMGRELGVKTGIGFGIRNPGLGPGSGLAGRILGPDSGTGFWVRILRSDSGSGFRDRIQGPDLGIEFRGR